MPTTIKPAANTPARRASFDPTGRYRYSLTREWSTGSGRLAFVMLNPSSADHTQDDPTIRRCTSFARAWSFAELEVVNLFALRATNPRELTRADDPIGAGNARALRRAISRADEALLAWGSSVRHAPPAALSRALASFARAADDRPLSCLGRTASHHPRHPLFVPGTTPRSRCALRTAHKKGAARSDRPAEIILLD